MSVSIGNFGGSTGVTNGYDIIGNFFEGDGTQVMMALSNLIIAILAGVMILVSIYGMLVGFGVIKKSKALGFVNFLNIIFSIAFVVFSAISLFCTVGYVGDNSGSIGGVSGGMEIGWAVIVNFCLAVVSIITTILASKFSKK